VVLGTISHLVKDIGIYTMPSSKNPAVKSGKPCLTSASLLVVGSLKKKDIGIFLFNEQPELLVTNKLPIQSSYYCTTWHFTEFSYHLI
jgi:hypothetical protein